MIVHPAVIVHGVADAKAALAPGLPVTLLSAPGAALFAGCLWWREIVAAARSACPETEATDILDCADASGMAMGALRSGVCRLVLWPDAPGWDKVVAIAARQNGFVMPQAPAALDLAQRNAIRRLHEWLRGAEPPARDSSPSLS
ncbi:MAG TPA: hypothetical protein VH023_21730 [Rhodopila sp.]|jgi:hypothetical protein|nr:hypothetical protein [Rhodopila sp.]